jgi:benzylsuccinate CoA-transferase BbsE subunit
MSDSGAPGASGGRPQALAGLRAIELASERGAYAGKLLADMGADVILVEPPGGDASRRIPPFLGDVPDPEQSLFFWHYNTSKRGVVIDLESERGREQFRALARAADFVLESENPGRLAALGVDYPDLAASAPRLIWVSQTPFGRNAPRAQAPATDLTLLAGAGPAWSCGYDDHTLPPIRGSGNQAYHTGGHFAVMSALVAWLAREATGRGQLVDVNLHAASNVSTEAGSYEWLVARATVQRQTGRHATVVPTLPTQIQSADGRYVTTGILLRTQREFRAVFEWIESLGWLEKCPDAYVLQLAAERSEPINLAKVAEDPEVRAIMDASRESMNYLAAHLCAYDFFAGAQQRGIPVGIIYSPEEALQDPHFVARGFPTPVAHPDLGRSFTYPGAPYLFHATPWRIRSRAPRLGEHQRDVFREHGLEL